MGDRRRVVVGFAVAVALLPGTVACKRSDDSSATTTTALTETTVAAPATTTPARTTNPKLLDVNAAWHIDGNRTYTDDEKQIIEAYVRAEQAAVDRDPQRCIVRFFKSGAGTATVTIEYSVFWVSTTGQFGWVPTQRTATFPYQVRGYEAVIR